MAVSEIAGQDQVFPAKTRTQSYHQIHKHEVFTSDTEEQMPHNSTYVGHFEESNSELESRNMVAKDREGAVRRMLKFTGYRPKIANFTLCAFTQLQYKTKAKVWWESALAFHIFSVLSYITVLSSLCLKQTTNHHTPSS